MKIRSNGLVWFLRRFPKDHTEWQSRTPNVHRYVFPFRGGFLFAWTRFHPNSATLRSSGDGWRKTRASAFRAAARMLPR